MKRKMFSSSSTPALVGHLKKWYTKGNLYIRCQHKHKINGKKFNVFFRFTLSFRNFVLLLLLLALLFTCLFIVFVGDFLVRLPHFHRPCLTFELVFLVDCFGRNIRIYCAIENHSRKYKKWNGKSNFHSRKHQKQSSHSREFFAQNFCCCCRRFGVVSCALLLSIPLSLKNSFLALFEKHTKNTPNHVSMSSTKLQHFFYFHSAVFAQREKDKWMKRNDTNEQQPWVFRTHTHVHNFWTSALHMFVIYTLLCSSIKKSWIFLCSLRSYAVYFSGDKKQWQRVERFISMLEFSFLFYNCIGLVDATHQMSHIDRYQHMYALNVCEWKNDQQI